MSVERVTRSTAYLVFSLALLASLAVARAATVEWIAAGDGDWNNPANWSSGALPGAADDVVVNRPTPVTITHAGQDTQIKSLDLTGNLVLTGGSLTLLAGASRITANLTLSNGATLTATGSQAALTVTGATRIDDGNLYALSGARISLPGVTRYSGSGVLRAQGSGSRLELTNLSAIGVPLPDEPLTQLTDAISREVSVYQRPLTPPELTDAISREISIYHASLSAKDLGLLDAASREISIYQRPPASPPEGPAKGVLDAASREISVYQRSPEPPSDGPAKGILNAISREISVYHRPPEPPSDGPAKGVLDAISREISVENPVTPP